MGLIAVILVAVMVAHPSLLIPIALVGLGTAAILVLGLRKRVSARKNCAISPLRPTLRRKLNFSPKRNTGGDGPIAVSPAEVPLRLSMIAVDDSTSSRAEKPTLSGNDWQRQLENIQDKRVGFELASMFASAGWRGEDPGFSAGGEFSKDQLSDTECGMFLSLSSGKVRDWFEHDSGYICIVNVAEFEISISREIVANIYDSVDPAELISVPDSRVKTSKKKSSSKKSPRKPKKPQGDVVECLAVPDGFTLPREPVSGMNDFWGSSTHKEQVILESELSKSLMTADEREREILETSFEATENDITLSMYEAIQQQEELSNTLNSPLIPQTTSDYSQLEESFKEMNRRDETASARHSAVLKTKSNRDSAYEKLTLIRERMETCKDLYLKDPMRAPEVQNNLAKWDSVLKSWSRKIEDAGISWTTKLGGLEQMLKAMDDHIKELNAEATAREKKKKEAQARAKQAAEKKEKENLEKAKAEKEKKVQEQAKATASPSTNTSSAPISTKSGVRTPDEVYLLLTKKCTDAESKKAEFTSQVSRSDDFTKKLRGAINKLASKTVKLESTFGQISQILEFCRGKGDVYMGIGMYTCAFAIVKHANKFDYNPPVGDADEVYVYAALAAKLADAYNGFRNLFRGELFRQAPMMLPIDPKRSYFPAGISNDEFLKLCGYRKGEEAASDPDTYIKDSMKYARLYCAFLVSCSPGGEFNEKSMTTLWEWTVRLIQRKPEAGALPGILASILQVGGHALASRFGRQFLKVLHVMKSQFVPKLPSPNGPTAKQMAINLSKLIDGALQNQRLDEPRTAESLCQQCRWRHCQGCVQQQQQQQQQFGGGLNNGFG